MFKPSFFAVILLLTLKFEVQGFITPPRPSYNPLILYSDSEGQSAVKQKIGQKTALVVNTRQKVEIREKAEVGEPVTRRKEEFREAPMYKLMLIGDDTYEPAHVIDRITSIMEDIDDDRASTIVQAAQAVGKSMCGKYPMEHAEMYKEQLIRSDPMIYADIENE